LINTKRRIIIPLLSVNNDVAKSVWNATEAHIINKTFFNNSFGLKIVRV